jgi:hypothetical protein
VKQPEHGMVKSKVSKVAMRLNKLVNLVLLLRRMNKWEVIEVVLGILRGWKESECGKESRKGTKLTIS